MNVFELSFISLIRISEWRNFFKRKINKRNETNTWIVERNSIYAFCTGQLKNEKFYLRFTDWKKCIHLINISMFGWTGAWSPCNWLCSFSVYSNVNYGKPSAKEWTIYFRFNTQKLNPCKLHPSRKKIMYLYLIQFVIPIFVLNAFNINIPKTLWTRIWTTSGI